MTDQAGQIKKAAQIISTLLVALLVVAIAQSLAQLTWRIVVGNGENVGPMIVGSASSSSARIAATGNRDAKSLPNIAQWNLFGVEQKNTQSVKPLISEVKAPDTKLRLLLKGVYVSADDLPSSAIVADKGKSESYFVGDKLPGGVTLHKVLEDRILLARGARLETLRFSEKSAKGSSKRNQRVKPRRVRKSSSNSLLDQMRSGAVQNPREIVDRLSSNSGEVLDLMINEVGLEDLAQTGEGEGFRVGARAPKDVLSAVGLRRGDVVHSVNGLPLGDIQNDPELMQEILGSGKAKIEIQRGKRRFVVTYPIPQF